MYPTTSSRLFCVKETCIVDVWRPSFTSLTWNVAAPACVLRTNSRWRVIVCGWFCLDSVVRKWVDATWRKTEVTKPPCGTKVGCF